MEEAERFVRDAMSFSGYPVRDSGRFLSRCRVAAFSAKRFLCRFWKKSDESSDPFSYAGVPVGPKSPRLKSSVRLPLP
jgi:hypothetical protein